jgi:hypothetical protein
MSTRKSIPSIPLIPSWILLNLHPIHHSWYVYFYKYLYLVSLALKPELHLASLPMGEFGLAVAVVVSVTIFVHQFSLSFF